MAEEYKIEHGVPIPPKVRGKWGLLLSRMKPGDSVLIPTKEVGGMQSALTSRNEILTRKVSETHHRMWYLGPRGKGSRTVAALEPEVLP